MRIIFVRHGHPDYKNDCLTELGHKQAKAMAERLKNEKIVHIYSSPQGRATQTAQYIAEKFGLEIEKCDFMREISWGSIDENPIFADGHPWDTTNKMANDNLPFLNENWRAEEPFCNNKIISYFDKVSKNFDEFLETLGYLRDGNYYRVLKENNDTVVLTSHGGSSSAVLSHIFSLPFPFVLGTLRPKCTSISIIEFKGEEGTLISPVAETLNDFEHIRNID